MHRAFADDDVNAARAAALEYDSSAEVSASYETKALDPVLAIMLFVGGVYFNGFLGAVAADHYDKLKALVQRLREDLRSRSQIVIEDDAGLQLVLSAMTPAEALDHLPLNVREAAGESGQLYWDDQDGTWKAPF